MLDEGLDFTCNECGARELLVRHEFTLLRHIERGLDCHCGSSDDGVAARRTVVVSERRCNVSELLDDHRLAGAPSEREIEGIEEEVEESSISCADCVRQAATDDWVSVEEEEPEAVEHEFWVVCSGCGREVEFGWSHPDRGGGIWPAESTDFNPWKSWPEPRYRESWLKKGWIPPDLR